MHSPLRIVLTDHALRRPADLTAIGCFEGEGELLPHAGTLERSVKEMARQTLHKKKFSAKSGESLFIPLQLKHTGALLFLGLGKREAYTLEKARRAASRALSQARSFRYETLRLDLESFARGFSLEETAAAAVEGLRLSDYRFIKYKSSANGLKTVTAELSAARAAKARVTSAIRQAEVLAAAVYFTRDLANEPANVMTPKRLADAARAMARRTGLRCRVYEKAEIRRMRMGGVIGVSQGSVNPPRFIVLEHNASRKERPLVLVGKGVTFDTGGISLKPSGEMDRMKFDMCGAAAVLGAMKAIAELKVPLRVVGIAPCVENMPGPTAQRPGDIIRCLNGKTIEVLNTDAEGRLILADALSYAQRFKPRALVDIATLTGACAQAFGDVTCGIMGTDPDLIKKIIACGERTGERCWELPLWEEYGDLIRATYADIQNISKRHAGAITAGMFLKEFAEPTRVWAHLDVAGTSWADSAKPLSPVGATGYGVRLFVELARAFAAR